MVGFVDGKLVEAAGISRAASYGDGCFTTIAVVNGQAEAMAQHWQRLRTTTEKLGLAWNAHEHEDTVARALQIVADEEFEQYHGNAVLKIHVSAAAAGRGYARADACSTTTIMLSAWPQKPDAFWRDGVTVMRCQTPVSINSSLAGLKHLNRLDSVLASAEVKQQGVDDGLIGTTQHVIEATSANLFLIKGNQLLTPALTHAGVAGIARARILDSAAEHGLKPTIRDIEWAELSQADELLLSNAVLGCWPIRAIAMDGEIQQLQPSAVKQTICASIQASLFPGRI